MEYLACPQCGGDLHLHADETLDDDVRTGRLSCTQCPVVVPITGGVPSFLHRGSADDVTQTTSAFARNWERYNAIILDHARLNDQLFRDWVAPLDPRDLEDRVVVDVGCGMGRWMHVASQYRPRVLLGLDYSSVVHTAWDNVKHLPRTTVVQADLFALPLKPKVEVLYCIGVAHHTPDPSAAVASLARVLAPDGALSLWVYGRENNDWLVRYVNPVRHRVTSRLPHPLLLGLSRSMAGVLHAASWLYGGTDRLPYADYMRYLKRYPLPYMEHIVYDHLAPQICHYIPRQELEKWLTREGLVHRITPRNGNSWRALATRQQQVLDHLTRRQR